MRKVGKTEALCAKSFINGEDFFSLQCLVLGDFIAKPPLQITKIT